MKLNQNKELLSYLMDIKHYKSSEQIGKLLFDAETEQGLPVEFSLDLLTKKGIDKELLISSLMIYQKMIISHKLISGMDEEKLDKFREMNLRFIVEYFKLNDFIIKG